jgi:hypothetical protein
MLFAGLVASSREDEDEAAQLYAECARLAREEGDSWLVSIAVNDLGNSVLKGGEYELALELFEESLAIGKGAAGSRADRTCVHQSRLCEIDARRRRARSLAAARRLVAAREIGHVDGVHLRASRSRGRVRDRGSDTRRAPGRPHGHAAGGNGLLRTRAARGSRSRRCGGRATARLGEDACAAMYADGCGLALDEALALASAQTEPESRCRGEGFDGERFLLARAVGSRWNADEVSAEAKPVFPHGSLSPPETMSAS